MTAPLLQISNLRIRYGELEAVRRLDLTVARGETVVLAGESGCGKSTSALAVMGLLPPEASVSGQALLEGRDILALKPAELRALRGKAVSMVFQDSMTSLNPVLTVGAQIVETLKLDGLDGRAARARAVELLDLVDIPEPARRANDYPHQFSGGQRQRVAIAMAVARQPRLLVADEPTTALDAAIQARILELLDRLKRELGMGLLLITHDLGVARRWADRVAVMLRGEKVEDRPTEEVFARPAHPYTHMLLGAALSMDGARHYRTARLPERTEDSPPPAPRAPRLEVVRPSPPAVPEVPAEPLLSLRDVHVRYEARGRVLPAVNGVSFDLARGETVGLVGESGCGKSTLSRAVLRLLSPWSGTIRFEGQDITRLSQRALRPIRPRMQMVFQDPFGSLNPRHSVGDILESVLKVNGVADVRERRRRIREMIDRVGLAAGSLDRYPHEFSGGQRQRIGIARALILRPALLICDEPASSLDLPIRAQVLNLLVDLKQEFGLTYLFISHDLSVVRYMADRLMVMQDGRIVEQGDHREIWANPNHPYTRSLLAAVPGLPPARAAAIRDAAALPRPVGIVQGSAGAPV